MERTDICKLCCETFDDRNRPRVLHCGHSYCTDCLDKLFDNVNISCPKCKRNHRVSSARNFPINYDLEESLSDARNAHPRGPAAKFTKIQTMIDENKTSVHNLILSVEDMRSQLRRYDEFLLIRKVKHDTVLQKIHDLGSWHEVLVEEIKEERQKIMDVQKKVDGYSREVNNKLPSLNNATSNKAAVESVTEIVESLGELEGWLDFCQQEFPYPKLTVEQQVLAKSMDSLSFMDEIVPVASNYSNNGVTIMERVAELDNHTLTLRILRNLPEKWRKRIASGRVYAIDSSTGRNRSANLSLKDGKMYLHYLQDRDAPFLAHTISHSIVVNSLNKESTVVFMDLAWDGSFKGRVHILLSPDTPLARHFRIFCTGDSGLSYAHSKFIKVICKNTHTESILGGNCEYKEGVGGGSSSSVMEGINKRDNIYYRKGETGVVLVPKESNQQQILQFIIITGSGSNRSHGIFGKVKDGIDVLKDAARFRDIQEVEIINCGVQLPL